MFSKLSTLQSVAKITEHFRFQTIFSAIRILLLEFQGCKKKCFDRRFFSKNLVTSYKSTQMTNSKLNKILKIDENFRNDMCLQQMTVWFLNNICFHMCMNITYIHKVIKTSFKKIKLFQHIFFYNKQGFSAKYNASLQTTYSRNNVLQIVYE